MATPEPWHQLSSRAPGSRVQSRADELVASSRPEHRRRRGRPAAKASAVRCTYGADGVAQRRTRLRRPAVGSALCCACRARWASTIDSGGTRWEKTDECAVGKRDAPAIDANWDQTASCIVSARCGQSQTVIADDLTCDPNPTSSARCLMGRVPGRDKHCADPSWSDRGNTSQ